MIGLSPGVHTIKLAIADAFDTALGFCGLLTGRFILRQLLLLALQYMLNQAANWIGGMLMIKAGMSRIVIIIYSDPLFVKMNSNPIYAYYLSQTAAGQLVDSNCVDAGDPASTLDVSYLTTRTDQVPDAYNIDMGYHYDVKSAGEYKLTIKTIDEDGYGDIKGEFYAQVGTNPVKIYAPHIRNVPQGAQVRLHADPYDGYLIHWIGTDNDLLEEKDNVVTMDSDKIVTVSFYKPRIVQVSGGGNALKNAVNSARHGDKIVVEPGTYNGDISYWR